MLVKAGVGQGQVWLMRFGLRDPHNYYPNKNGKYASIIRALKRNMSMKGKYTQYIFMSPSVWFDHAFFYF